MLLTTLPYLKTYLDIPQTDTTEDAKLSLLAEDATSLIEEWLNRNRSTSVNFTNLAKATRTEFYDGTNTHSLVLRHRPVWTADTGDADPAVRVHDGGYWGEASGAFPADNALTYGDDFVLRVDQPDGTSRSAILVRIGDFWPRNQVRRRGLLSPYVDDGRGNIRCIYVAGWTADTIPAAFRLAANLLVARLRAFFPYGERISSESYEERSVSYDLPQRDKLFDLIHSILWSYRNFFF